MKTISTALILMFALTFTTSCKKEDKIYQTETNKEILLGNDWKITNGSLLNGRINQIDTILSFEVDSTLTVLSNERIVFTGKPDTGKGLFINSYSIKGDSVNINFEIEGFRIGNINDKIYNYTCNLVINSNKTLSGDIILILKTYYFEPVVTVKYPITLTIK